MGSQSGVYRDSLFVLQPNSIWGCQCCGCHSALTNRFDVVIGFRSGWHVENCVLSQSSANCLWNDQEIDYADRTLKIDFNLRGSPWIGETYWNLMLTKNRLSCFVLRVIQYPFPSLYIEFVIWFPNICFQAQFYSFIEENVTIPCAWQRWNSNITNNPLWQHSPMVKNHRCPKLPSFCRVYLLESLRWMRELAGSRCVELKRGGLWTGILDLPLSWRREQQGFAFVWKSRKALQNAVWNRTKPRWHISLV